MKDLYDENFRTLKNEIRENFKRWNDLPFSWIGRINTIEMSILPKALYKFNNVAQYKINTHKSNAFFFHK